MTSLRSGTLTVAGLFLSAAIIAAVLALALWDFKAHQTQTNLFYGVGVLISFVLNFLIVGSLIQGVRYNLPHLMLPYLVCASFHLLISLASIVFFTLSVIDERWSKEMIANRDLRSSSSSSIYALIFFVVASFAWIASILIVSRQRRIARKLNGQYCAFDECDFIN